MQESATILPIFVRVGVVGGGCSGLSYKLDFDNEQKPMDQVFEDNGVKVVTDLKSFLYLVNTMLDFSDGLNGKGFFFNNPNASAPAVAERASRCKREPSNNFVKP
jgi:iron-sulfur cluster assembly accessory protein